MKIKACPKCGSRNIAMGGIGDGVLFGIDSWKEVCRNCNYQGAPILFDCEKDYKKFLNGIYKKNKSLSEKQKIKTPKFDEFNLSNKIDEKEINSRWKLFLISVIISIFITIFFIPNILSIYYIPLAILSIIGQFIILLFTVFVLILFVRFLIYGRRCRKK